MKDIDMSRNVHSDLVSYVYENLPSTLETPLEKAIGVYTLVCNVLKYDPDYVVYGDFDRTEEFQNVTREKNILENRKLLKPSKVFVADE